MHELSLVESILSIVEDEQAKHGLGRLKKVVLVNGALAGAVTDSLRFAWEALTPGTAFEGVELVVEEAPLRVACGACGEEFTPEDIHYMPCPKCEEFLGHKVLSGKELYIASIEAE